MNTPDPGRPTEPPKGRPAGHHRTLTAEDGPQDTAAAAYQHAADMVAAIAAKSRNQQLTAGSGPVFVRVERVEQIAFMLEQIAFTLGVRAEEARRT